jgi:DNA-binding HxlR family transcriptional regulator
VTDSPDNVPARRLEPGAPVRQALERLANRWTVLVVNALEDGPARFNQLRARLGVSAQVLSRVLRELERDGLVERTVYPEIPVRVEYTLSALGGSMCPVVQQLYAWAEHTAPAISAARRRFDGLDAAQAPAPARQVDPGGS